MNFRKRDHGIWEWFGETPLGLATSFLISFLIVLSYHLVFP